MTTGAVLLIDVSARQKVGLVGGNRRLIVRALPNGSGNSLVRNGLFQWQRAAFRTHEDPAASSEKVTGQQDQTDSNNKTEEEFNHRLIRPTQREKGRSFVHIIIAD